MKACCVYSHHCPLSVAVREILFAGHNYVFLFFSGEYSFRCVGVSFPVSEEIGESWSIIVKVLSLVFFVNFFYLLTCGSGYLRVYKCL